MNDLENNKPIPYKAHIQNTFRALKSMCERIGLDDPKIEEIGRHYKISISKHSTQQMKILFLLENGLKLSTKEISEIICLSVRRTRTILSDMNSKNLIHRQEKGRNDPSTKYYRKSPNTSLL